MALAGPVTNLLKQFSAWYLQPNVLRRVPGTLFLLVILAIGLGLARELYLFLSGLSTQENFGRFFRVDAEGNFPTAVSSFLMLLAAFHFFWAARFDRPVNPKAATFWTILSVGFVYLALDEALKFHEKWAYFVPEDIWNPMDLFTFRWVIFGIVVAFAVFILFLWFLPALSKNAALNLMIAGTFFVGGAIGVELIGGFAITRFGREFIYAMTTIAEEGLELIGMFWVNWFLISYLREHQLFGRPDQPVSKSRA